MVSKVDWFQPISCNMKGAGERLGLEKEATLSNSAERNSKNQSGVIPSKAAGSSDERRRARKAGYKKGNEGIGDRVRSVGAFFGTATKFLKESRIELKKVKWPTKKELLASTAVVIVLVLIVSLYLGIVDFGLIKLVKGIIG